MKIKTLCMESQSHAVPFYQGLGFRVVGEEFMDAVIPHINMIMDDLSSI